MKQARQSRATPKPRDLLGAHVSTAGGVDKAIDRALIIGATAMQIFVKNNMQWFAPSPIPGTELRAWREHPQRDAIKSVFGHSGYMINLAAANPEFRLQIVVKRDRGQPCPQRKQRGRRRAQKTDP